MASESIRFDFLSSGAGKLARDFKSTGDNAAAAARGAKVLQDVIGKLGQKENRTAAESATLARALRLTGDAEDRAAAKALAADIAIRRLDDAMQDSSRSAGRVRGGFAGLAGEVTGFGAASTAASGKSTLFARALAGLNLASGVLEPALAGVVVAGGGIAAAYASAGLGLGVFGAVAGSVLSQASDAAKKYTAAQQNLNLATTSAQRVTALRQEKAALYGLDAAQRSVVFSVIGAQDAWQGFTRTATPGVARVLAQAVRLLPEAFALMRPFLAPVESALGGFIGELRAGIAPGSEFSKIMRDFAAHSGTTLRVALDTAWHLFMGVLGVVHAFLPEGGKLLAWVDQASVKFEKWGKTLGQHSGFQSLMATFRTETPQAVAILKNLAIVVGNVGKAMFGLSTFSNSKLLLQALLPLSGILAGLSRNTGLVRVALYLYAAGTAASKLKPAFLGVKAGIEGISTALKFASANPIVLVAAAVVALGAAFYLAWKKSAGFRDIIKTIGSALLEAGIIVVKANKIIIDSFLSMVGTVLHAAATAFGWVPGLGDKLRAASRHFDGFKAGVDNVMNGMIGKMQDWQNSLNQSKATVATATASIVANFRGQGKAAMLGRDDVNAYTVAVQSNGARSDAARSARARLIGDLRASGLNARDASRLVDTLQGSIDRLHGKNVPVGVHGSGSGGVVITTSGIAAAGQGNVRFHAAQGGRVPFSAGTPGRDSVLVMTKPGEIFIPPEKGPMLAPALKAAGIPGFAAGGFAGMESALGSVTGTAAGLEGRGAAAAMAAGVKAAIAKEKAAVSALNAVGPSSAGGHVGWSPGAGVDQWRLTTLKALGMLGLSPGLVLDVLYQMMTESGGNPNIVNRWDSNWLAGHPSVGLMQVIRGTYQAYAGPFRGTGPFSYGVSVNPLANIYAALNYGKHNGRGFGTGPGQIGSGHGYAEGGVVPGYAAGGTVAAQGAAWLKAWQTRHGGGFGAAWGPVVVNEQIARMNAAMHRAQTLAGARGLTAGQHKFWASAAADEKKRLGVLNRELTTERAWRAALGTDDAALAREIAAAGKLPSLAGPARGWKAQLSRQKATIAGISKMLGYSGAYLAAHPPAPKLPPVTHTYGGDVANNLGAVLASALGPFTGVPAATFDRGGTLRPGWNATYNATGRPEHLVPARSGGKLELVVSYDGSMARTGLSQQQLTDIRYTVKTVGGGSVERTFGAH